ncbi:hypothetical protein HPB50_003063 [Hyalomma asiaticum]|uniref:Uncharacterized protein n=1 Tax=Hyalomma asiaticum TaxID=266040 RepID=A0ACB7T183_HYAAI|nr:hypothetical protein HPB50_003063 [Hyalomma asiaticum]
MASQPPQKAYAFDVVVPEGAGPEDVVDATASTVGIEEVYCVQHFGGRNFQVTVNSEAAMARYLRIEMKPGSPVPNYLKVAGRRVTCDCKGMQRVCRRCGSSGHFRMNCSALFCARSTPPRWCWPGAACTATRLPQSFHLSHPKRPTLAPPKIFLIWPQRLPQRKLRN